MNTKLQTRFAPLAACLAFAIVPAVSHADDGGGDYNFPSSNVVHEPVQKSSLSCAEAKQAAWFNRAVEISDGDVSPAIPMPAECDRKVFAQVSSGDDEEK